MNGKPHRPAYLAADLVLSLALIGAYTWGLARAVLLVHLLRPLPPVVLALLLALVAVFSLSCTYTKLSYFRLAMRRSRWYWRPYRKEHP